MGIILQQGREAEQDPQPVAVLPRPSLGCGAWSRTLCLAVAVASPPLPGAAQEAPPTSLSSESAAEARARQQESRPYNFHWGDFKLLVAPMCRVDWNDNINLSHSSPQQDWILGPELDLAGSYPISRYNYLNFALGVGYDKYFQHEDYSGVRLRSGSQLSFDIYVEDFWFNLHDAFSYTQDAAGQAAVAGNGRYGGLDNTAGLSGTWDLQDLVLSLGYDHQNFVSASSDFDYADRATELVSARAALQFNPRLTAGLEGTVGFTKYDQPVLNNNIGYNAGLYAEFKPGPAFQVKPRFGYTFYDLSQTSHTIPAENQNAWYVDFSVTHAVTKAVSYSLSGGHELRLGIQADSIEDWYVRPNVNWNIVKDLNLNTYVSYENGRQGPASGGIFEDYSWAGLGLGVSYPMIKRLILSLEYRLTLRSSNIPDREYTQNLVGVKLTYQLQ